MLRLKLFLVLVGAVFIANEAFADNVKYDDHKVVITSLGGKEYHIPGEYLGDGAPISDFSLAILVRATLPDFTMPPKDHGKSEAGIYVRDVSDIMDRLNVRYQEDLKRLSPMKRAGGESGLQRYITSKGPFTGFGLEEEYYVDDDKFPTVLITCGTETSAKNPQCQAIFVDNNLMYIMHYPKTYLSTWRQMRERSVQLTNSFYVSRN